ncbi:MAG: GFA family protein [Gammaproteobacteria bacterium]|nr:GFA family protein [Gammaproteobacteria bacterium]
MEINGRCLCGAVSFVAESVDTNIHSCHCDICRKWSGGPAFAASVGSVSFEGEEHVTRYDSSEWAERGFCSRCGGHLFYRLKEANHYVLWMGTFDDLSPFKLAGEIYIDQKPAMYNLAGDHPRLTGEQFMASVQEKFS